MARATCLLVLVCLALLVVPQPAYSQANPEIANCLELKDEATAFQAEICSAHVGCKLVMGIQGACAKTKAFLDRLKAAVQRDNPDMAKSEENPSLFDRMKSLLSKRPEVNSNQVFEATMTESQKALEAKLPEALSKATEVAQLVAKSNQKSFLEFESKGFKGIYVGDVAEGKAEGAGTFFWSSGVMTRGGFKNGEVHGSFDKLHPDGERNLLEATSGVIVGNGVSLEPDGRVYSGHFYQGLANGPGTLYRADGTVRFKGIYQNNEYHIGDLFDSNGNVTSRVNKPRDAVLAAQAREKAEAEAKRNREFEEDQRRRVAEQAKQDAIEREAREFQGKLSGLNAGQLFALADELMSQGNAGRAREVRRSLVSRFPDHPLAATAAQQMSGTATAATPRMEAAPPQPVAPMPTPPTNTAQDITTQCREADLAARSGFFKEATAALQRGDMNAANRANAASSRSTLELYQGRCSGAKDAQEKVARAQQGLSMVQGVEALRDRPQQTAPIATTQSNNASVSSSSRVTSRQSNAEPAMHCISVLRQTNGTAHLQNKCNVSIEAVWCVVALDCKKGGGTYGYSNLWSIGPGRSYPVSGSFGRQIKFAACTPANSRIVETGPDTFSCE